LQNPEEILQRFYEPEKPDRWVIISVPNVANIWIRLNLLFGKFEYTDRGILDRTHVRFYTRSSLLQMAHNTGLEIQRMEVTPIPLNLLHSFFSESRIGIFIHRISAQFTNWFPTLLGYQFILYTKYKVMKS
jgi:hypothetical protein